MAKLALRPTTPRTLRMVLLGLVLAVMVMPASPAAGGDLADVKARGALRHLGVPYANFVTGLGDGMDVELVQLFAKAIGVKYEFIPVEFNTIFPALTGRTIKVKGDTVEVTGEAPIQGDIGANGLTVLPWREAIVNFSDPVFPNQVWVVARADSAVRPIRPTGSLEKDILEVKKLLRDRTLLGTPDTCLDPSLYDLEKTGALLRTFRGRLDDVAPAVIKGEAELSLLDVPDALISLQKWPGKIKIIGPVSERQAMATAFAKESPALRKAFNRFLQQAKRDGTYLQLVKKYYPYVFTYYPEFFAETR